MGGVTLPTGYSFGSMKTYNTYVNNKPFKDMLKDGKDAVRVTVVDSRGNSTSFTKNLNVSFYSPPYFAEIEAKRDNSIDAMTKLIGIGIINQLDKVEVFNYTVSTTPWVNGASSGTKYGPYDINLANIVYTDNETKFQVNEYLKGNLGSSGFTKGIKYYIKINIATEENYLYPFTNYVTVEDGKILMAYAKNGVAFGADYDEVLGGAVQANTGQVLGAKVLFVTSTAINSNVTLNDDVANYKYIEIFYHSNDSNHGSCKIADPSGRSIDLTSITINSGSAYTKFRQVRATGNQLINQYGFEYSSGGNTITAGYNIFIYKVVGYK